MTSKCFIGPSLKRKAQTKHKLLLKKYKTVFSDQLGTVKFFTTKLVLRDDTTPKFCKARSVPYSLRAKVEVEIDRLQDTGILMKEDRSKWATPIVPIVKKDGSVRKCRDFKVTVISMLHVDQYPLPRLDDIFAALAVRNYFSKIDLKQAYLQLPVEESSKQYLTVTTSTEVVPSPCSGGVQRSTSPAF